MLGMARKRDGEGEGDGQRVPESTSNPKSGGGRLPQLQCPANQPAPHRLTALSQSAAQARCRCDYLRIIPDQWHSAAIKADEPAQDGRPNGPGGPGSQAPSAGLVSTVYILVYRNSIH